MNHLYFFNYLKLDNCITFLKSGVSSSVFNSHMFFITGFPSYKFISTNRGRVMLIEDYTFARCNGTTLYYCSKKNKGCKAKVKLDEYGNIIRFTGEHNHDAPKYIPVRGDEYVRVA